MTDKLPEALKADFGVNTVADLQKIPFDTLQDWWSENQSEVYHLCVRDGKAISYDPFADWTNGTTKDLIILQGHTANEYQYYQYVFNDDADFFNAICSTTMAMQLESGSQEFLSVFENYKQALLDLGYTEDSIAREYCNDRSLAIGNTYQATKHAQNGGKGYFYIFEQSYDGSMAQYGAAHAIDCYYLFGTFDGNDAAGTKEEVDLSRRFQHMIANFCVTGDPSTEDLEWPVYTAEDRCTMMIGQNMHVEKDPETARVEAALKMIDLHEDFRYLKSFSSIFPVVQKRYPEVVEAYIMNAANPEVIEIAEDGEILSRVFYCHPMASWEKGDCENNHALMRRIIPKGRSFAFLTQEKVDLMMNNINSYPRAQYHGKSAYEMFVFLYGQELARKLGLKEVPKDQVVLKPELI